MNRRVAVVGLGLSLIAAQARAVTYGWEDLPDGGVEYIVQVEPILLDAFREKGFWSDIPSGTKEIRRITLKIGEEKLPHEGTAPPAAPIAPQKPPEDSANPTAPKADAGKAAAAISHTEVEPGHIDGQPAKPLGGGGPFESMFNRVPNAAADSRTDKLAEQTTKSAEQTKIVSQTQSSDSTFVPPQLNAGDSIPDQSTDATGQKTNANKEVIPTSPESRPWLPLMLALVALFASLGVNAYLAWIHQSLRSNYRLMAANIRGDAATA